MEFAHSDYFQEVSLQDVRKEINFCRKVNLPILGVVENMSGFVCPKCKVGSGFFWYFVSIEFDCIVCAYPGSKKQPFIRG